MPEFTKDHIQEYVHYNLRYDDFEPARVELTAIALFNKFNGIKGEKDKSDFLREMDYNIRSLTKIRDFVKLNCITEFKDA